MSATLSGGVGPVGSGVGAGFGADQPAPLTAEIELAAGCLLPLQREPANPHDALAIMILDETGHHLGYVPRVKNEAVARLMDAGKLLFARLESKAWEGKWLRAEVRVFLRDL